MKFIYNPDVEKVNSALTFQTPDCKVTGGLDLYTTKPTGTDRKLQKTLDKNLDDYEYQFVGDMATSVSPTISVPIMSPPEDNTMPLSTSWQQKPARSLNSTSPFGPLDQQASRKVFAYVISILNSTDSDHDFSSLRPEDFKKEESSRTAVSAFNNILYGLGVHAPTQLWDLLDREMDMSDCSVYSHVPSPSYLADEPGTIWAQMWFFFNKKRKRVAYLNLRAVRNLPSLSPGATTYDITSHQRGALNDSELEELDYDLNQMDEYAHDYYDDIVGGMEME